METRRAVPTEYRGVRFRSKSEACFAMYIEHHVELWEYEPRHLTLDDGYVPDFRIILGGAGFIWCKLIEYKPSRPNDTYALATLEKLAILSNHVGMDCNPCIQFGSFWNNDPDQRPATITLWNGELHTNPGWATTGDEWALRQQISQHRFDLADELSQWKGYLHG